ncbi:unnamed protein product [Lepeophtheirus salmonis]|uniref:(salmon louse) hypothetical protein n=1 Tax=Lepeophtheirus salmonis TaxID=72036 RepID=A0A7R8CIX3_LEPSM|nr:unnamed protein product [Lepeophtheirus salmonis]CAF2832916.1 unnamed protein product [Lepeophtheirus salmonis]
MSENRPREDSVLFQQWITACNLHMGFYYTLMSNVKEKRREDYVNWHVLRRKELVLNIGMLLKIWLMGLILVIEPSNPHGLLKNTGKSQDVMKFQSNAKPVLKNEPSSGVISKDVERENKCIQFRYLKLLRMHVCVKFMVQDPKSNKTTNTGNTKRTLIN